MHGPIRERSGGALGLTVCPERCPDSKQYRTTLHRHPHTAWPKLNVIGVLRKRLYRSAGNLGAYHCLAGPIVNALTTSLISSELRLHIDRAQFLGTRQFRLLLSHYYHSTLYYSRNWGLCVCDTQPVRIWGSLATLGKCVRTTRALHETVIVLDREAKYIPFLRSSSWCSANSPHLALTILTKGILARPLVPQPPRPLPPPAVGA